MGSRVSSLATSSSAASGDSPPSEPVLPAPDAGSWPGGRSIRGRFAEDGAVSSSVSCGGGPLALSLLALALALPLLALALALLLLALAPALLLLALALLSLALLPVSPPLLARLPSADVTVTSDPSPRLLLAAAAPVSGADPAPLPSDRTPGPPSLAAV